MCVRPRSNRKIYGTCPPKKNECREGPHLHSGTINQELHPGSVLVSHLTDTSLPLISGPESRPLICMAVNHGIGNDRTQITPESRFKYCFDGAEPSLRIPLIVRI